MTKHFERLAVNLAGRVSRRKLNGRSYLVAPVVLGCEGVLAGNAGATGPGFYAGTEWAKAVPSWNMKPITNGHPKDAAGNYVSAADEGFLETHTMGFLLGSKYDNKLRANAWFDEEKTLAVEPRVHQALLANKVTEVSTGVFVDEVREKGEYNGKPYDWKAINHQPDHLAVLVDEIGACSVADGAGLLQVNSAGENGKEVNPSLHRAMVQSAGRVGAALVANELSFSDVSVRLTDALAAKYGEPGKSWPGYITDVYPDRVVFRKDYGYRDDNLFMVGYSVSDKDEVSLTGEARQVERVTTYRSGNKVVGNVGTDGSFSPFQETESMFDKAKHLGVLIGNGGYAEADREWLSKLPDDQLEKIKPVVVNSAPVPTPTPAPAPTPAPVPAPQPAAVPAPMSFEQLRANADAQTRDMLDTMYRSHQARFAGLVQTITSTPGNTYTPEQLNAMPVANVEQLAAFAANVTKAVVPQQIPVSGFPQQSFLGAQGGGFAVNSAAPVPSNIKAPVVPVMSYDESK